MATVEEWAWAAGLFEGEGSIYSMDRAKDGHHQLPVMRLAIQMSDRDVVERFCRIVECGKVGGERRFGREHHKPMYMWVISRRSEIERLLLTMLPWFGERRSAKAHEALAEIAKLNMTCEACGTGFRASRLTARFCSQTCQMRTWHLAHRGPPSTIGRPRTYG